MANQLDELYLQAAQPEQSDVVTPLHARYRMLRSRTLELVAPLDAEDMVVQGGPDASPAKWHLAHTTWFFETFLLKPYCAGYREFDPAYAYLFNSYYEALGPRQPRPQRGMLTRPRLADVLAYRHHVDGHMDRFLRLPDSAAGTAPQVLEALILLGLAHEEQHQELLLMDILYLFGMSPLRPAYDAGWLSPVAPPPHPAVAAPLFRRLDGGLVEIGVAAGEMPAAEAALGSATACTPFSFDNEGPRHRAWLQPFEIDARLVTNREWMAFMADGGYSHAQWWLADGWTLQQSECWQAPMYWQQAGDGWQQLSLRGLLPVDPDAAVTHISYYEADAYASWAGARLPTEAEWEHAAASGVLQQAEGVVWQWTRSAYAAYPGFRAGADAVGEYNGKFMVNQMVLRGGASVTPVGHTRPTYRNFFHAEQRWMFAGLRLARDVPELSRFRSPGDDVPIHNLHNQQRFPLPPAFDAAGSAPAVDRAGYGSGSNSVFAADVLAGLSLREKSLSPKYFYDADGSDLFEEICLLPEYYPTRTETALLQRIAGDIAQAIPQDAVLVEFGSGASDKTRLLLDAAPQISVYVPIDISIDALEKAAARLSHSYPDLLVAPVADDFTSAMQLPIAAQGRVRVGFFPGSTIGNFTPPQAVEFLRSARRLLGDDAMLIVGADLVKDQDTLVAAYDDAAGVTARFNKNLLLRINRELGGDFSPDGFDHLALWNETDSRMEMHLVSRVDQIVNAAGRTFAFKAGERLHTENSHKFTPASFAALASEAGWQVRQEWISEAPQFAVFCLSAGASPIR